MRIHTPDHISCWRTYSRILNLMTLMETLPDLSPEEREDAISKLCEQSENARHSMTLDEIVFWAGIATGLQLSRNVEAANVDPELRDRVACFATLFAESTKSAVVEMTIRDLEE